MYLVMLPRLEAERQLDLIQAALAAGGQMLEDRARSELLAQLERRAEGQQRRRRREKPDMTKLQGAGIEVVLEPAEEPKAKKPPAKPRKRPVARRSPVKRGGRQRTRTSKTP
jgi:hypothetical protein